MIHYSIAEYLTLRRQQGKKEWALFRILLHDLLREVVGRFYECCCYLKLFKPCIIVYMDGGICSQMYQYLIGQIYAEQGEDVYYDLQWYHTNGMDTLGKYPRIFELTKLFPNIQFQTVSKCKGSFYKFFLMYSTSQFLPDIKMKQVAPIYLGGYYDISNETFSEMFEKLFVNAKKARIGKVLNVAFPDQYKCAVHVRRGDLAQGDNLSYGGVTDDYFFAAISYIEKIFPETRFFFFSDEMEYVKSRIVPWLKVDYVLEENHRAYEDLLMISMCDAIISSQGSFGKIAAMLNPNSLLLLFDNEYANKWVIRKHNTVKISPTSSIPSNSLLH